jgi:membrane-associated phospholipid phosphatase
VSAVLLPLAAFGALAAVATEGKAHGWDADAVQLAERHYEVHAVDWLDALLRGTVGLAAALTAVAVIVFLIARKVRHAVFWAVAVGGVIAVDAPLKAAFHRPAFEGGAGDYSFPSGGAMVSMGFLLALALTLSPPWRRRLLILGVPLLVGYGGALVYSWWHYPSDVLGGWCLSFAWVVGLWLLLLRSRVEPEARRA